MNNNQENTPTNNSSTKKSIIIGVTSSIIATIVFLYLLDPIISLSSRIFIFLFKFCSSSMQDRLYTEIALGKTDFAFTSLMIIVVALISFTTILIIRDVITKKKISDKKPIKKKINNNESSKSKVTILANKIFKTIGSLALLFIVSVFISFSFLKINTIDRFDQHIKILTPYISAIDKDLLISEFSNMRSKNDYVILYKKIYYFAKKNNINLPETTNYLY